MNGYKTAFTPKLITAEHWSFKRWKLNKCSKETHQKCCGNYDIKQNLLINLAAAYILKHDQQNHWLVQNLEYNRGRETEEEKYWKHKINQRKTSLQPHRWHHHAPANHLPRFPSVRVSCCWTSWTDSEAGPEIAELLCDVVLAIVCCCRCLWNPRGENSKRTSWTC